MTKEEISAYNKKRYQENKEKIAKKYQENKEEIIAYEKKYREINKEKLSIKNKEREQTIKGRYSRYKKSATQRGYSFDLSEDEFKLFWQKDCSYCGSPIKTIGLDRIDSSIGYQIDNIISCCTRCNRMKSDHTTEEWIAQMYLILKHQETKKFIKQFDFKKFALY